MMHFRVVQKDPETALVIFPGFEKHLFRLDWGGLFNNALIDARRQEMVRWCEEQFGYSKTWAWDQNDFAFNNDAHAFAFKMRWC